MQEKNHYLNCNAPICAGDPNPNYKDEVTWFPGECICKLKPYQKFQEVQIEINDWLRKNGGEVDVYYTANELEKLGKRYRRQIGT